MCLLSNFENRETQKNYSKESEQVRLKKDQPAQTQILENQLPKGKKDNAPLKGKRKRHMIYAPAFRNLGAQFFR